MNTTVLHIKNMVCPRCIKMVRYVLEHQGQAVVDVSLGKAIVEGTPDAEQMTRIAKALEEEGFTLLDDRRLQIVESIKNFVIETVHYGELDELNENFSTLLSQHLQKDYQQLSKLFSETEHTTIEQYVIQQKIERVKELLVYNELTLSEIAYKLGYSSVAHLSGQFKKVTGLTPSHFKAVKEEKRKPLDKI